MIRLGASWALAGLAMASVLVVSSCASKRQLTLDEVDLVAWFIEDVAHDHVRRAEELELPTPSPAMREIAVWAHPDHEIRFAANGQQETLAYVPPMRLQFRRNRLPALHGLFISQVVVSLPNGLVAVRPGIDAAQAKAAYAVIDPENIDRRELDAEVVGVAKLKDEVLDAYLAQIALARVQLDRDSGAVLWSSKDHGTERKDARPPAR